jgi:alpha-1,3/alpha-1,6-mannosyltransferase
MLIIVTLLGVLALLLAAILLCRRVPSRQLAEGAPLRVSFVHPDLGIGGAENLMVNAAVALQKKGHAVRIYTAHHDPAHCFAETRGEGRLAACITVHGDWLPRTVLGAGQVLCAIARTAYASLVLLLTGEQDVIFVDQVAAVVPLLRLSGAPVLFYCHFPDKLLCTDRGSALKRLYRRPIDALEERTTAAADMVVVNSRFTAGIFRESFPSISASPDVLYPPINADNFVPPSDEPPAASDYAVLGEWAGADSVVLLSINRFERKKNLGLAVEALAALRARAAGNAAATAAVRCVHLVLAGGYDHLNPENVQHLQELKAAVAASGMGSAVHFLPSFSDAQKVLLLKVARAVVYTPDREHFGIVPVEAMYAGVPVVAVASGGPLETVVDGETGFLCEGAAEPFAEALHKLVLQLSREQVRALGMAGHARVKELFTLDAFGDTLDRYVRQLRRQHCDGGKGAKKQD